MIVEYIFSTKKSDISSFQLIVEFNQQHQSILQQDFADARSFIATISIANLETSNNFQQRVMPSCIHQLIVKLTLNTDSDGVPAQENILNATGAIPTIEGARVPTSKLIVIYSKKFLYFRKDCGKFCEGEWEQQWHLDEHTSLVDIIGLIGHIGQVGLVGLGLVDHIGLGLAGNIGLGLVDHNGLVSVISLVGLSFFGVNGLVSVIGLNGPNDLVNHMDLFDYIGLVRRIDLVDYIGLFDHIGLVGRTVSFIGLSLVGFIGLSLAGLSGLSDISGLIGQISLIDLSALSNHWPISLISLGDLGITSLLSSSALSARWLIGFVSLVGSSTHRLFLKRLIATVIEATKISWQLKQATALGVAMVRLSATEIANVASTYNPIASSFHVHSLVRALLANPTTVTCYYTQNNYFLSGFRK